MDRTQPETHISILPEQDRKCRPSAGQWQQFIDRLLLWCGSLSLSFAILFFVAFNWAAMPVFGKFALLEGALVITMGTYWFCRDNRLFRHVALISASVLLGGLLALVGQIYQTGADPWQLFTTWALLLMPMAYLERSTPLFLLSLALLNVTAGLYPSWMPMFPPLSGPVHQYWLAFFINASALLIAEFSHRRYMPLGHRWPARLIGVAALIPLTVLGVTAAFNPEILSFAMLAWLAGIAGGYLVYRHNIMDVFLLACIALSAIVVSSTWLLVQLELQGLLFVCILSLSISGFAVKWLMELHHRAAKDE